MCQERSLWQLSEMVALRVGGATTRLGSPTASEAPSAILRRDGGPRVNVGRAAILPTGTPWPSPTGTVDHNAKDADAEDDGPGWSLEPPSCL